MTSHNSCQERRDILPLGKNSGCGTAHCTYRTVECAQMSHQHRGADVKPLWTQQSQYNFNQEMDAAVDNIVVKTYPVTLFPLKGAPKTESLSQIKQTAVGIALLHSAQILLNIFTFMWIYSRNNANKASVLSQHNLNNQKSCSCSHTSSSGRRQIIASSQYRLHIPVPIRGFCFLWSVCSAMLLQTLCCQNDAAKHTV